MSATLEEMIARIAADVSPAERADMPDGDFVFPDSKAFPVLAKADVMKAVHSWGRYHGDHSFDDFKAKLTALATRRGWADALPADWQAKQAAETPSLTPPKAMQAAARDGLARHERGESGDGLKPETVRRANQIADGDALTPEHVKEMAAWFARHDKTRPDGDPEGTPWLTAWLLWGGDAGKEWSQRIAPKLAAEPSLDAVHSPAPMGVAKKPTFLTRLYERIRAALKLGGGMTQEQFDEAVLHARGHAGGMARAESRRQQATEEDAPVQSAGRLLSITDLEQAAHTGVMVALYLPVEAAQALALPNGEPAEDLHITIAYLGKTLGDVGAAQVIACAQEVARRIPPMTGEIGGLIRFNASAASDGKDVIAAGVQLTSLARFRHELLECISARGVDTAKAESHPVYTPHVTLAYVDAGADSPITAVSSTPLRFETVTVVVGEQHTAIPLLGVPPFFVCAEGASPIICPACGAEIDPDGGWIECPECGADLETQQGAQAFAEAPAWIPYLPVPGTYAHPTYGQIAMSADRIARMVGQFNAGIYQHKLPLDAEHETKLSGAMGWITQLRQNADGSADAAVDWTDRGRALIASDRFKYISPEWYERWQDPATGQAYTDVAIGGALTTRPFFKPPALRPLAASEQTTPQQEEATPMAETENTETAEPVALTELRASLTARETEITALRATSEQQAGVIRSMGEKIAAMEGEAQKRRFEALIAGDKRTAALAGDKGQHMAMLGLLAQQFGESSAEFTGYVTQQRALAAQVQAAGLFRAFGGDGNGNATPGAWEQIEVKANEIRRANASLTQAEAISWAVSENPDLYAQYRAEQRGA